MAAQPAIGPSLWQHSLQWPNGITLKRSDPAAHCSVLLIPEGDEGCVSQVWRLFDLDWCQFQGRKELP
jgi:hypothetical protein